ncbi:MAG: radical SAM protein [Nitrospirae bacterium]|nr:MAG: radical SAM protein [Nitrospirota bacterium]
MRSLRGSGHLQIIPAARLRITEIFHSIQGESTHMGRPCVFIRLAGCPLRCTWCDTTYAFHDGAEMDLATVMGRVREIDCRLVEITGGEPLSQPMVFPLITWLCNEGFEVLIETSGAVDVTPVDVRAQLILDLKCPGSGMTERMQWANLDHLQPHDQVKFVIRDRKDYCWARDIMTQYRLTERCTVLVGPVFGELEPRLLAEWVLADRLPVRMQLQLHKYIWDPAQRGV